MVVRNNVAWKRYGGGWGGGAVDRGLDGVAGLSVGSVRVFSAMGARGLGRGGMVVYALGEGVRRRPGC